MGYRTYVVFTTPKKKREDVFVCFAIDYDDAVKQCLNKHPNANILVVGDDGMIADRYEK